MPTNASALSKLARLSLAALDSGDGVAGTIPLSFTKFDPGCRYEKINIGENVGGMSSLGDDINLTRNNVKKVSPRSSHKPGTTELIALLNSVFNMAPTGTGADVDPYIWKPAATQRAVDRNIEYHDTQRFWRIQGCCVSKATFQAASKQELVVDLEWEGRDYTNTGTYPSLTVANMLTDRFLFVDGAVDIDGVDSIVKTRSIKCMLDHVMQNDRFFYGATSAGPINTERRGTLSLEVPYGLHNTIIDACAVEGGAGAIVSFSNPVSGSILTFNMPAIRTDATSVSADVPQEMFGTFEADCYEILDESLPCMYATLVIGE